MVAVMLVMIALGMFYLFYLVGYNEGYFAALKYANKILGGGYDGK